MWEYKDTEYIKVFRRMLNWEWYTDTNTKVLFLHCLLKANWRDAKWQGRVVKRGEFITSLASLSRETGLTVRQVRTSLEHLKSTGEVTSREYSKFRVITVNSYDEFQSSDKQNDKQATSRRQASDKQPTTDIRNNTTYYEEYIEEKEIKGPAGQDAEDEAIGSWLDDGEGEWV